MMTILRINLQIKAVERLVVAERESIAAAFERQRAEGLARNDAAFEENLAALDKKAGKSLSFRHSITEFIQEMHLICTLALQSKNPLS